MAVKYITSQSYLDDDTVESKRANKDYEVAVSPSFFVDGQEFRVVLDGHHSFSAAIADGVSPDFLEMDSTDNDAIEWLKKGDVDTFLEIVYVDTQYFDIYTGVCAF